MSHNQNGHITKPKPIKEKRSYKGQIRKYNPTWELMPEFTEWLQKSPYDSNKAWCNFCQRELRTHLADLKTHRNTSKHLRFEAEHEGHIYEDTGEVNIPGKFKFCRLSLL